MRIRTLLNKFEYLKSFVYEKEYIEKKAHQERLIIEISARKNGYEPILDKTKYSFLKKEENLTKNQDAKLKDIFNMI